MGQGVRNFSDAYSCQAPIRAQTARGAGQLPAVSGRTLLNRHAHISSCGRYRSALSRVWNDGPGRVLWCCLNPSLADGNRDDRSLSRMIGFSRAWGYSGCWVVNLFDFITPYPEDLLRASAPISPLCDSTIKYAVAQRPLIIVGWGSAAPSDRAAGVLALLRDGGQVYCLGRTRSGAPRHPLYLRADLRPVPYL